MTAQRRRHLTAVLTYVFFALGSMMVVRAQEPLSPETIQARRSAALRTLPGKIIAEGRMTSERVRGFVDRCTVEELKFDDPIETVIKGSKTEVYKAYRITFYGGPFPIRAMEPLLKIDDGPVLVGQEGWNPDRITFILYELDRLRDGSTLSYFNSFVLEFKDKSNLTKTQNRLVGAQELLSPEDIQVRRKAELHTRPGKIIAEGRNTNGGERSLVNRYTVEELKFEDPIQAEIKGSRTEVYKAYRITVYGGRPFHVGAMAYMLKIDDGSLLSGVEGRNLDKITFVLYDREHLRDGATLFFGYGGLDSELSDKLKLTDKRAKP